MKDEPKLKQCPFCGCIGSVKRDDRFGQHYWMVGCFANMKCEIKPRTLEYFNKESAIESWNTRKDTHDKAE
jgi:hypothetical protein